MSVERRKLLAALGANIDPSSRCGRHERIYSQGREIRKSTPGAVILGQFSNQANPAVHFTPLQARRYGEALDGHVDVFVGGVGTGGTISGVGRFLKSKNLPLRLSL